MENPIRKILLPLLFSLPLLAPAQSVLDKKCDLHISQKPIPDALEALAKNCGLDLVFSRRFFRNEKPVSVQADGWEVARILGKILAGTEVGFRELDGQVVFFLKEKKTAKPLTISGYVEDAETGERLIAAAIFCPNTGRGTITNEYGFFSLNLPAGPQKINVSYLGYEEKMTDVELSADRFFNFGLSPALTLAEVVVTPTLTKSNLLPSPGVGINLTANAFPAAPDLGGESDLLRIVQMLPGVQTGADGFGGLNIRCGSSEQNLILLDGVPVYNPAHVLGLLSIFNTSAVKNAQVIKSGIPARYGGRISSVIDVRTREGSTKKWSAEAGADFISGKAAVQIPFGGGRGSLLLAGRRAFNDFLLGEVVQRTAFFDQKNVLEGYLFSDFNGKISFRFSEKNRWFLSYYRGWDSFNGSFEEEDELEFDGEEIPVEFNSDNQLNWGNDVASLRWNRIHSPQTFSNTTLTFTKYEFLNDLFETTSAIDEELEDEIDFGLFESYGSDVLDVSLRTDSEMAFHTDHYFRFGGGAVFHSFQPVKTFQQLEGFADNDLDTLEIGDFAEGSAIWQSGLEFDMYFEDEFKVGEAWHFNAGLRMAAFVSDKGFIIPEPRLSASYRLNERVELSAAIDRTSQFLHRLNFNEINLPSDVWIPADAELAPQKAWQATLGTTIEIREGLEMDAAFFHKKMRDVKSFAFFFEDENGDEIEIIPNTDGTAYGLEFFLRKAGPRTGGWLSYTWSKADRTVTDLSQPFNYTFRYDRRHDVKIFLYHRLTERLQFGLNWVYGTPQPELRVQEDEDLGIPTTLAEIAPYPFRPLQRMKPYHRLDLSARYSFNWKKLEHTFKVSAYNLYDRKNTGFFRYFDGSPNGEPVVILPFVLGVYYGVKI